MASTMPEPVSTLAPWLTRVGGRYPVRAWLRLLAGQAAFAVAVALMIRSGLGLGPWDAFHMGVHALTGWSIGTASIVVSLVILVATLPVGVRPGPATLANMVLLGVMLDAVLPWVPAAPSAWWATLYYALSLGLFGTATGLYLSADLGRGPRDGMMMALSRMTGWKVGRVRTLMEVVVLALGWAMGGKVGVGTLVFAAAVGPLTQWGMTTFGAPMGPDR